MLKHVSYLGTVLSPLVLLAFMLCSSSLISVQEEKRAWVEEWERRQEQERVEWRKAESGLRERVYRLEAENKEAKDTIENLIAFQQRKNRKE